MCLRRLVRRSFGQGWLFGRSFRQSSNLEYLEYSTCGRDTALKECGERFECGYHVGWFRVECGGAACSLVLVYVLYRLREVQFSSVEWDSAQQTRHNTCEVGYAAQGRGTLLTDCRLSRLHDMHLQLLGLPPSPLVPVCRCELAITVKVSGCSWPRTLFLVSITCTSNSSASVHRPCFLYVDSRLPILIKVCGCSWPSTFYLVSMICTSSTSASFHRPWFLYVDARLPMLVKVSGCSWPSTLLNVSMTCTSSSSASFNRPWSL